MLENENEDDEPVVALRYLLVDLEQTGFFDEGWEVHHAAAAGLRQLAEVIGRSGDVEAIRQAIGLLLPPSRIVDGTVRRERAGALAVLVRNVRGAGPLLAVLESEQVQAAVAWALDEGWDREARETLAVWGALRDLATHDPNTRRRAADRLGKLGDARAVEPLVALAADVRQEEYVRRAARAALQQVGGSRTEELRQLGEGRAVKVLAAALAGGDRRARMKAAEALGRLGLGEAVEPLAVALADRDWRVREVAAWALGEVADDRATEALATVADDRWERKPVRDAARSALERIRRRP